MIFVIEATWIVLMSYYKTIFAWVVEQLSAKCKSLFLLLTLQRVMCEE